MSVKLWKSNDNHLPSLKRCRAPRRQRKNRRRKFEQRELDR